MEIKRVSFKLIAARHPEYKHYQAYYDEDKDLICIDRDAPEITAFSYHDLLRHEKGHRLVRKAGVASYFTDTQEELFADLMMYAVLKGKNLEGMDKYLFEKCCGPHRWRNKKDRPKILARMLKMCKVKATQIIVCSLAGAS